MQLNIKPYKSNLYPLAAVLIKGTSPAVWAKEIQSFGVNLDLLDCYVLPDTKPNSVWGCLVVTKDASQIESIGQNNYCQLVNEVLFIPTYSDLHPTISAKELQDFLLKKQYVFHPEFGLVALEEKVDWLAILELPQLKGIKITTPKEAIFIPKQIKSFEVEYISPEENLEQFLNEIPKEKLETKPLNFIEKTRLAFYRKMFQKEGIDINNKQQTEPSALLKIIQAINAGNEARTEKMFQDYQDLEERNKKEVDKLLSMFEKDPLEALKYAIPLDQKGINRGGDAGAFKLNKQRKDFSFGSNNWNSSGGGGTVDLGNSYYDLQNQYSKTALELIKKGNIKEAAFVYHKLLGNHLLAAETLENGKYYAEAASIYLKYLKNKAAAARCYELAKNYEKAIELLVELNDYEKAGDICVAINKIEQGFAYYEQKIDTLKGNSQYVKAALIYRAKMNTPLQAQALLKEGWLNNQDAFNCINNYFQNIVEDKVLWEEINTIYQTEVDDTNNETFLKAMKYEYKKGNKYAPDIREIAYEIIAQKVKNKPSILKELEIFNPNDRELNKDIIRYKNFR